MRVRAVARINYMSVERLRDTLRKTGLGVAHDRDADAERAERNRRILERLAFRSETQIFWREIHDVGPEPQLGEIERRECAGALLEEHVDARDSFEQRTGRFALELRRALEYIRELVGVEIV